MNGLLRFALVVPPPLGIIFLVPYIDGGGIHPAQTVEQSKALEIPKGRDLQGGDNR